MICKACKGEIEYGMNIKVTATDTRTGEIVEVVPEDIIICYGCYDHNIPMIGATVHRAIDEQQG